MIFSLDVRRARKGDCLLLHHGSKKEPRLILIDGGPAQVYKPHLKPRLDEIRAAHRIKKTDPLPVDVMMVSHLDDDHIRGILELTSELRDARQAKRPLPLRVRTLWHNSFDKLLDTTPAQLEGPAQFGTAALGGEVPLDDDDDLDVAKVLASIPQGFQLRTDAEFLNWRVNADFDDELVMATADPTLVTLGDLSLTVVGPIKRELVKLQQAHDRWVKAQKAQKTRAAESALAAYRDASVTNLSSLVLLATLGKKRLLLTGDARGDKILEGLELTGLVEEGKIVEVDVLKVPHHGSANNIETEFFERVRARDYVFSGNGEHGNPERETIEMLFAARGNDSFVLHFTYPIPEIDAARRVDWDKKREEARRKGKTLRAWSDARDKLETFFRTANVPNRKQRIAIVPDTQPHVLDLADPLGF